ncbi:hypothetical protein CRE_29588 [Caenorhabditis remanei]|uniref:Uncharacterized protein n=1 Tax=Caenorhabditis remanei TaxID=31234 RepID=E3LVU8_CAERE|nr:hypothetical protein CRE_29588 [Caenorhabditis remanei]
MLIRCSKIGTSVYNRLLINSWENALEKVQWAWSCVAQIPDGTTVIRSVQSSSHSILYLRMSSFFFYLRNRSLTPFEQNCLDDHSRQMAQIMISTEEKFHVYERLAKVHCSSGPSSSSSSIVPPFIANRAASISRSVSSGSSTTASSRSTPRSTSPYRVSLVANPFYDPSYKRYSPKATTASTPSSGSTPTSPLAAKLIANPFYDPSYVLSSSKPTSSDPTPSFIRLIPNPFYNPNYVINSQSPQ